MAIRDMMTSSSGNIFWATGPLWGEFTGRRWPVNSPHKGPVTRSFDAFFDLHLNKRLSKPSRRRWFVSPSGSLWRHCNGTKQGFWRPTGQSCRYHTIYCDVIVERIKQFISWVCDEPANFMDERQSLYQGRYLDIKPLIGCISFHVVHQSINSWKCMVAYSTLYQCQSTRP